MQKRPTTSFAATVNTDTHNIVKSTVNVSNGVINGTSLTSDPKLGSLANNGGPTFTFLPSTGSPAIGGGTNTGPNTDQRGLTRVGTRDIGAVQVTVYQPPQITSNGGGPTATIKLNENVKTATTVTVNAQQGAVLQYSISGGNDASLFTISSSGVLQFKNAPDFENPIGSNGNSYQVIVRVSDGTAYAEQIITVQVQDVDEPPSIADQSLSINENSAVGTTVGTVVASGDTGYTPITYAITGGTGQSFFSIDPTTGKVTFTGGTTLDRESATISYTLTVKVTEHGGLGQSTSATVTVNVADVNDNTPVFTGGQFTIPENTVLGTSVGTVSATDADATAPNNVVTFSIVGGNFQNAFAINNVTGEITVANSTALDFDTHPVFSLSVKATDGGTPPLSATATVTITLTAVFEPTPPLPPPPPPPPPILLLPDGAHNFMQQPLPASTNATKNAVNTIFQAILGHLPDQGTLYAVASEVDAGHITPQALIQTLWNSPEHRFQQIDDFAVAIFGAHADPGAAAPFVGQLVAGVSEQVVLNELLNLRVGMDQNSGMTNVAVIQDLFSIVLGRTATNPQLISALSLISTEGAGALVNTLVDSGEAKARLIEGLFEGYLGHSADPNTIGGLVGIASQPGVNLLDVVNLVILSPEFINQALSRDPLGVMG